MKERAMIVRISLLGVGFSALLLSGCLLSPQVTQLERMKQNRDKGDLESNSRVALTCTATDSACYQLHLIKGDACSALAARAAVADPVRRSLDACAADNLLEGVSMSPAEHTPVGDMRPYRLKRLEALRDLIDTRRAQDSSADTLAQAAQDFRNRYSSDPAGPFYLASARLTVAQDEVLRGDRDPTLCSSLSDIDSIASGGSAAPGDLQAQYHNLAKSIADMRRSGGCT
jgi:hypothetical protein